MPNLVVGRGLEAKAESSWMKYTSAFPPPAGLLVGFHVKSDVGSAASSGSRTVGRLALRAKANEDSNRKERRLDHDVAPNQARLLR
jgi:hypothetical protein